MVDQPGAIAMWVSDAITFDYTDATWVTIHKTAGFQTAQDVATYFQNGSNGENVSAHYVVGLDGTIVQCVPESRGAGANCCLNTGHAGFLPTGVNLNTKAISIEHVDPRTDNQTTCPPAQKAASFKLIYDICKRHNIPMRRGDASGGIIGHNQIDPVNRARCPGNYPWDELLAYLKNGGNTVAVPDGWQDKNGVVMAPNGVSVKQGFADFIRKHEWDGKNQPIENEQAADPVEDGFNQDPNSGTRQLFNYSELAWTSKRGVYLVGIGNELKAVRKQRDDAKAQAAKLQAQVTALQSTDVAKLQSQYAAALAQVADLTARVNSKNSALTGIATAAQAASK